MAGISFILALLLGGAAFLFRQAAAEVSIGTPWASDVCSTSQKRFATTRNISSMPPACCW